MTTMNSTSYDMSEPTPSVEEITWDTYRRLASRTWKPKGNLDTPIGRIGYPFLGLGGELGEVTEHILTYHKQNPETRDVDLMNEVGDVLWYAAVITLECGLDTDFMNKTLNGPHVTGIKALHGHDATREGELTLAAEAHMIVAKCLERAKKTLRDKDGTLTEENKQVIQDALLELYPKLSELLETHNTTLAHAACSNLTKLAGRAQNNKIRGEGSNR
jgi:NTP pyrophosphatase (non-canonical NTP hydrolase)